MRIQREAIPFLKEQPNVRRGLTVMEVLVILAIIGLLAALLLLPDVETSPRPARRSQCRFNLKLIGLALHNYHDAYGAFPPAYTVDESGRPLHSWRTLILPYLDQAPLYNKIDLTKPWNDPVNLQFAQTSVPVFSCPSFAGDPHLTLYHAIVAEDSILNPGTSKTIKEISDGTSNTLLVLEVDKSRAVPWMSPSDHGTVSFLRMTENSVTVHRGAIEALLADGSVRTVSVKLDAETRRRLISSSAGDVVNWE
jgi:type II secretory pathway pseudopilin PulG